MSSSAHYKYRGDFVNLNTLVNELPLKEIKHIIFKFVFVFQLFDHIAECIYKFMNNHDLLNQKIPLGFTFSFPCKQMGLNHAVLTQWTKGFKCEGVEGEDVVRLLHEAIKRRGVGDLPTTVCLYRDLNVPCSGQRTQLHLYRIGILFLNYLTLMPVIECYMANINLICTM